MYLTYFILSVPSGTSGFDDLPPSKPVLCYMLCPAPCKVHLLKLSCHGSPPGGFGSTLTAFPSWGPSKCSLWDIIRSHSEHHVPATVNVCV